MSEIDASRFDQLAAAVRSMSAEDLTATIQQQQGGVDSVLDQVFAGMAGAFVPERAAGQEAVVQYDIAAPDGTRQYRMRIADGRCEVGRGPAEQPRATVQVQLPDFLKLLAGALNPMQAVMTGKLKIRGDMFFLQTMQGWFERPAG
ncbi:MAG TPA: SCP2 sterol-binding domain-containing protein [Actinomycetes bacterium]|nr:SCP2 sterol-binding domain-containing protein [Actinomycetes bacterium]